MNEKTYEKPEMNVVSYTADKAVANTCWGHHSKGTTLYSDIPGAGFCSFKISNGSCALNLTEVKYYEYEGAEPEVCNNDEHYRALYNVLVNAGGAQGNPFAGEGTAVKDKIEEGWS